METGRTMWTLAITILMLIIDIKDVSGDRAAHGILLGKLSTLAHKVTGEVYVVDTRRLKLVGFTYDGTGPDAFFWIGKKGQNSTKPSDKGMYIPDENGRTEPLKEYKNRMFVLTLPDGTEVTDIAWLSVWCRQFAVDFGHIMFPVQITPPAPQSVGQFSRLAHQVRSGDVVIIDSRTVMINNLHYDGRGPDAFFWVGKTDSPSTSGYKVPDETGSLNVLRGYSGKTITLRLPESLNFYNIKWLSLWCIQYTENFGNVLIPSNLNVPPYIDSMKGRNCEKMSDKLNVAWEINSSNLTVEISGVIEADDYMAFGLSASSSSSSMSNADVIVSYYDNMPKAVDYKLTQYAQCSNGRGACPDTRLGGMDNTMVISGSRKNSITTVKYSRPLQTGDSSDKDVEVNKDMYIVWAVGKLNSDMIVTKHGPGQRLKGNKMLNFSRKPVDACTLLKGDIKQLTPWPGHTLTGKTSPMFTARIGPSGGRRGYNAITNSVSWGIAWYINDTLIPEITLKRGVTYTFHVQGGNNVNNTAEYHPFYITDDPIGGYVQLSSEDRKKVKVFAGITPEGLPENNAVGQLCEWEAPSDVNPDTFNTFGGYFAKLSKGSRCTNARPGVLTWTPDSNTPDTVYYQCYQHRYLGWKINMVDEYTSTAPGVVVSMSLGFVLMVIVCLIVL